MTRVIAVARGEGSHRRLVCVSPAAKQAGVGVGVHPSRARAIASAIEVLEWAEAPILEAGDALDRALELLTPRLAPAGLGARWLEVAGPERVFAARVLDATEALGFARPRIGVADGTVAARAAAIVGEQAIHCVPPGGDRAFLGPLSVAVLPLSPTLIDALGALGISTVARLREVPPGALVARFGPAGRSAARLARARADGQGPRVPRGRALHQVDAPLMEPCEAMEPLLFVLRRALERLVRSLAGEDQAIAALRLVWARELSGPLEVDVVPATPTADAGLLFEMARARLRDLPGPRWSAQGEDRLVDRVCGLSLIARRTAPRRAQQLSLPLSGGPVRGHLPGAARAAEMVLARLTGRLGEERVGRPGLRDTHRPERVGVWRREGAPPEATLRAAASTLGCARLLEVPRPLREPPRAVARVGPERLSGHWWEDRWDREYWWVQDESGRVWWLFQDRRDGSWWVHGWLD